MLEKKWQSLIGGLKGKNSDDGHNAERGPKNLILYGPPGTGKTHYLNRLVNDYVEQRELQGREAWLAQELQEATWFDVIFAALYALDGKAYVSQILEHEFIGLKAKVLGRKQNVRSTIWACLQSHTHDSSETVKYKARTEPLVFDKLAGGEWCFAGDWKEECADQIHQAKSWKDGPKPQSSHSRYVFVTFHQAYSYEDFIEGIRPDFEQSNNQLSYTLMPGLFKQICQRAKVDPHQRYAIFIDEVNRGNVAKIFGELITLIEEDKRAHYDSEGGLKKGMEVTLPYSGEKFGVPVNLDIFCTMNTADRSIALLDTALRRRFEFKELMPDVGVINGSQGDGIIDDGEGDQINLREFLRVINRRICFMLSRDMTIGHAYLMNVRNFKEFKHVLFNRIIPLLQEYFYDDWHRIQLVFQDIGLGGQKSDSQIICNETFSGLDVIGFEHDGFQDASNYWVVDPLDLTPDAIRKVYEEGE